MTEVIFANNQIGHDLPDKATIEQSSNLHCHDLELDEQGAMQHQQDNTTPSS